tara:strand:- start:906 stop:1199 length:294 start_codon:yes stop_codon:yes gene_type:complete
MISVDDKLEKKFLDRLQLISEQISDLIYKEDFSRVEDLDRQRQIMLSSFKHKLSDKSKSSLMSILEQNKKLIDVIENEKLKLNKNYKKILNIFNAYK